MDGWLGGWVVGWVGGWVGRRNRGRLAGENVYVRNAPRPQQENCVKTDLEEERMGAKHRGEWWKQ